MLEQKIESFIEETLTGDTKNNAIDFVACLRSNEDFPLDEHLKEIAWKNVDFCGNCGYCTGGTHKTVFGKEFDNVCRTTMIFSNPNAETLEFMKKMVLIRKHDIIANI